MDSVCGRSSGDDDRRVRLEWVKLSGAQIWGDPELGSKHAHRLVEWLSWVLLVELWEWQSSEQGPAWGGDPPTPVPSPQHLPGATTSFSGLNHEAICRESLAPGR